MPRRRDISRPRGGIRFGIHYDPEAFGRFSEAIARFLGTARYLVIQTVIIVVWVSVNTLVPAWRFDEYPYILLTLALSMQASYAAPLILLAQNRQEARDRESLERDRQTYARTLADTAFITRELASIRIALSDVLTNDDIDRIVDRVTAVVDERLAGLEPIPPSEVDDAADGRKEHQP